MTKQKIREEMKIKRNQLSSEEVESYSKQVIDHLLQNPFMKMADSIFLYASSNSEVNTMLLLPILLEQRGKVAFPKVVNQKNKEMDFFWIRQEQELSPGFRGILEPPIQNAAFPDHTVMLVPGLAFDNRGRRVGYGGGYYDRYLERHKDRTLYTIALAYEFQIIEEVPSRRYDKAVNAIVTNSGIMNLL